jgi:anti-anti-sigma factor
LPGRWWRLFVQGTWKGASLLPQQPHLDVRVRHQGATALLSLEGELDLASRPILSDALARLDIGGATKQLIIDLRGLEFMDSSGVHLLCERDALARADGHNLTIIRGRASVRRLCTLSGIEAQLIFVDDPADLRPPV